MIFAVRVEISSSPRLLRIHWSSPRVRTHCSTVVDAFASPSAPDAAIPASDAASPRASVSSYLNKG